jgi:hypothetical protein
MSRPQDEIVFEDLHGVTEEEPVTVDLDAALKDDGITRTPVDQAADAGAAADDDIQFDDLHSAYTDDAEELDDNRDDASNRGEDDDYSRKVKARIQRATRATKKAQQEADYWKAQAQQMAVDAAGRDKASFESVIEQNTKAISAAEQELERAIEDGNTKDQVRIQSELTSLHAEKVRAEVQLENLPDDGKLPPFDGKVPTSNANDQSLADKWVEDRADWYGARGFDRQTRLANRLDKEVFADGFDPKTEEYFEELDRRMKEKEPELYDDLDDGGKKRSSRRSPVAPVDSGSELNRRQSSSKVELDEDDFANMRRFGLDPHDPEVLKEYALNKRATLRGG